MSTSSPDPLPTAPAPRVVFRAPLRVCPRWDTPPNGITAAPGDTISGLTFSSNLSVDHEVVLLNSMGLPVSGVVITPPNPQRPTGTPPTKTLSLTLPSTGLADGNYYLQVRVPGSPGDYTHTIEVFVEGATGPMPLEVHIVPMPGPAPGTYPPGTWVVLGTTTTGGVPPYSTPTWALNGTPISSGTTFSFQLGASGNTYHVTATVTDSAGASDSDTVDYTSSSSPSTPLQIVSFRRVPNTLSVAPGTTVNFFATFAGGNGNYQYQTTSGVTGDPPQTGTTTSTGEVPVGSFVYPGPAGVTYTATISLSDTAGTTPPLPVGIPVTVT